MYVAIRIRNQANRFLNAFEAHGIARQQIIRVLPSELEIPPAAFSTVDSLKNYLSPALLDWAAHYLALERNWLDVVGEKPHKNVDEYKNEGKYVDFFEQRIKVEPTVHRTLLVWASSDLNVTIEPDGYLSLVYVEDENVYDDIEFSRYWSLSNQWPARHKPCVDSMLKVVRIARSHDIFTVGRILDHKVLERFESGQLFAPKADLCVKSIWYPEDLMEALSDLN